jgi:hypothetical protein
VNKLNFDSSENEIDFVAVLDRIVETATVLKISEGELSALLARRFAAREQNNVIEMRQPPRKMFNPEAGP